MRKKNSFLVEKIKNLWQTFSTIKQQLEWVFWNIFNNFSYFFIFCLLIIVCNSPLSAHEFVDKDYWKVVSFSNTNFVYDSFFFSRQKIASFSMRECTTPLKQFFASWRGVITFFGFVSFFCVPFVEILSVLEGSKQIRENKNSKNQSKAHTIFLQLQFYILEISIFLFCVNPEIINSINKKQKRWEILLHVSQIFNQSQ